MTVSNPPQSRGHVEPGGDSNSPPVPRRDSPASNNQQQQPASEESSTMTASNAEMTSADNEPELDPEALIAAFPLAKLQKLEELISNTRWVIPVLPKGELEVLLDTSIQLAKAKADRRCEPCMRFYREGLQLSFTRIMTDEAVSSWRLEIHKCILRNCEKLIELCVLKLDDDWFPLLDLLALVLNPNNKFHIYNANKHTEFPIDEPFARSVDARKGWLVDLINRFGYHGGFTRLLERFTKNSEANTNEKDTKNNGLNVALIYALVRPFGQCYELLMPATVSTYLLPIVEAVPKFLESLSDEELKKEAKNESKNDALSAIVKSLKSLASTIPSQEENVRQLELFRLKMILRQLQISSFGGKMSALNEVNRVISSVWHYPNTTGGGTTQGGQAQNTPQTQGPQPQKDCDEEFLTADRMAAWLNENKVLQIALQDNLHQPQYVEKLEKVIRFLIKEKVLSMEDLDDIWAAQIGQHEAIVKNVHDLLAKLAWDFTAPQMDHLFERFHASWSTANAKQREKLLELIRHLAEDDKEGVMADKVLNLFWNLAHSSDVANDIMDQALSAHIKILDYSCTQYREVQKTRWLTKCIEELKTNSSWVLPALKQIREICCLYQEAPHNNPPSGHHGQRQGSSTLYRHEIINNLQLEHALVILVADNLTTYVDQVRHNPPKVLAGNPEDLYPDGRYNHVLQVQERLNFLRFLLKDGQLWLCAPQAKQIWNCLAENAVFSQDREACFKWFSKLMGDEPDLDPEINRDFFENNLLQLDPSLMTESGIKCFDRFFKAVNCKENKLIAKRRAYLMDDLELIGMDYIWRLVLNSSEDIANKAIELLKETFTNLGPRLQTSQVEIHEDFISSCFDRLRASYDTITLLEQEKDVKFAQEATKLTRVLKVLYEYVQECDADFCDERTLVPLFRAPRGKQLILLFRFPNQGRQMDDLEIYTHTNDTLASVKRQIVQRLKGNPSQIKVELKYEGEIIDSCDDRKILLNLPFRDKAILEGKLIPVNHNSGIPASSPDSSSDSSTSSPQHHYEGGPNVEVEQCLPGVIIAQEKSYTAFLLQLADLGCSLGHNSLRDGARSVLNLIPADAHTATKMKTTCSDLVKNPASNPQHGFDSLFFTTSPSQTLYNLDVCYSLLMPSNVTVHEKAFELQMNIVKAKGIPAFMGMLTRNDFLSTADLRTKQLAYLTVLKVCKLLFAVAGHSLVHMVAEACQPDSTSTVSATVHGQAVILQQALHQIPSPSQEVVIRNISQRLATQLLDAGAQHMPNQSIITAIIRLAWASAAGNLALSTALPAELHEPFKANGSNIKAKEDDIALACEAVEVLALAIALHPQCLESLCKDTSWHQFIIDLTLMSNVHEIRLTAADQFLLIATRCSGQQNPIRFFITLLFTVLSSTATNQAEQSSEYFVLLTRLLSYAAASNLSLSTAESLLNTEINWLKKIRENVRKTGSAGCHENLLEGHLCICRDLLAFMSAEKKYDVGSNPKTSVHLVKDLVEDFIFPASKMHVIHKNTNKIPMGAVVPVCNTGATLMAAFDLLVALATGCVPNLKLIAEMLTEMFYSDKDDVINDWEYLPPVGPRPSNGFVGLKNAGATCYMNSVLQQLFMIESVRNGVLEAEEACNDPDEDFSGEDRDEINENDNNAGGSSEVQATAEQSTKEYNLTILKQVQAIFGHLAYSKLQLYVPRGLWKHFRMHGEPVNLREQQDADEFFMRLKEAVEDALKALGYEQTLTKILSGSFSDQKICKTCPHRYSSEVPFSAISVDVRNHFNLTDSLHEYVKGDLLDGSNAYRCERCDKKVDTIKRLCVKKLPPILVIQLKRFDFDYERLCLIKFNDYFEFPRELDMEPYTVGGLAKIEGEAVDCDPSDLDGRQVRKYRLRGIVVHSGQASGGHYYSFIRNKDSDGEYRWYKFDDGDVTEIKMDDDEELKTQCYGGEYMSEVFDPLVKRMSYRKQKRWWNAFMLFYTRLDYTEDENESLLKEMSALTISAGGPGNNGAGKKIKIPAPIEKSIQKQNVRFLHHRNQYTHEYFQFMRKIINANAPYVSSEKLNADSEDLALLTVQLASKFLFSSGLHTKKSLRGPAHDWYELLTLHLRYSKAARAWFCNEALFACPSRFCEYILECPTAEVRQAFVRIIVVIAHFSLNDGAHPVPMILNQQDKNPPVQAGAEQTLSDYLLQIVLSLLWMEVPEHGKHLSQYFSLFVMYASLGIPEKKQLLKLNVPATFINVALDEGPGPPIKYQYSNELGKLYQVVSQLIRCCDISAKCQQSANAGKAPLPNPYLESSCTTSNGPLMVIQPQVYELVFKRYGYLKKIIEEANAQEDTKKLLQFCSWENPTFSHAVLYELLWQVAIAYTYELRPYLDLLLNILLMEDSWQMIRIQKTLKGIPDEHTAREGLFDIIQKSKSHYQKRAYQCIKLLVALFSQCEAAKNLLDESEDIKRKWTWAVEWLNDELERSRGPYPGSGQFSYNNWSPPAQSNETANGYFLERSQSARLTLEKACELLPEEDLEGDTDAVMGDEATAAGEASTADQQPRSSSSQSQKSKDQTASTASPESMKKESSVKENSGGSGSGI